MSLPNTCGTCKYRGKPITESDFGTFDDSDPSAYRKVDTGYFLCDMIRHINGGDPNGYERGLPAGVSDGSGYQAAFCVSSDFGCNRWEWREVNVP